MGKVSLQEELQTQLGGTARAVSKSMDDQTVEWRPLPTCERCEHFAKMSLEDLESSTAPS